MHNTSTPRDYGFYMPAEWHPKQRTFMEWPQRIQAWPDGLDAAKQAYAMVANKISEFEPLTMLVTQDAEHEIRKMCSSGITTIVMEHDDSWMRDNGPTFVINDHHEIAGISWQFNAWGEKYIPYNNDNNVANALLDNLKTRTFNADIILEGGAIHVDGQGTLITTKECVLNKNRNKNITTGQLENIFAEYLGIKKVIWLEYGLYGDETDGHVDNVACFTRPGQIIIQGTADKSDPNYSRYISNVNTLRNSTDANGNKIEILTLEQPPLRMYKNERLTLSYINYYLVNGGLILPVFGGDATQSDNNAIGILQDLFPNRVIVPVDGQEIIKGGGNIHCITQQMPKP